MQSGIWRASSGLILGIGFVLVVSCNFILQLFTFRVLDGRNP